MTTPSPFTPSSDPTTPGHYTPSQTALLLLDFHELFIAKAAGPSAGAAVRTAARLRSWAKDLGIPVLHCLIDAEGSPFPTAKGYDRLVGIVKMLASGEPAELTEELTEGGSGEEKTFTRRPGYVSALKSPGLLEWLRNRGIRSLVLAGLSTSGCVLRTACAACDEEFVVTVVGDACADVRGDLHEGCLEAVGMRGFVVGAEELIGGFGVVDGEEEGGKGV
ncbi:hypothetical protein E8E13_009706 [Curvularia kusanoi]|uniref:Isochorismatase-like domain-containing protein n=1 Tax=Curvularia kusanoi TaxID=90978 RepID=A0A9P4TDT0_CURKU|nr:hypothetical protein E8E13_009706 [Curvularia kusanoi]